MHCLGVLAACHSCNQCAESEAKTEIGTRTRLILSTQFTLMTFASPSQFHICFNQENALRDCETFALREPSDSLCLKL